MPRPKTKENSRGRLCASLRSRNAHGHVTSAIFLRKFTGKRNRKPDGAPLSSTGLTSYRKKPLVWTLWEKTIAGETWTGNLCEDCAGWRQALWEAWSHHDWAHGGRFLGPSDHWRVPRGDDSPVNGKHSQPWIFFRTLYKSVIVNAVWELFGVAYSGKTIRIHLVMCAHDSDQALPCCPGVGFTLVQYVV